MSAALYFPLPVLIGLAQGSTEVAAPDYARQPAVMAYGADGQTVANTASIQWPHARVDWGTVDVVTVWEAVPGGARIGSLPVITPLFINAYEIPRIAAGGIAVVYARIPRTFGTGRFGTYTWGYYRALAGAAGRLAPRPWGVGGWGTFGYATTGGVNLEINFDPTGHQCAPGTWAPGPFSIAA